MKVRIDMNYWADVLGLDLAVRQAQITVPVWIDSRDLPEPPTALVIKTGDVSYKRSIKFQRQPDGQVEIAIGCWTTGEPGKLQADKVVAGEPRNQPARSSSGKPR